MIINPKFWHAHDALAHNAAGELLVGGASLTWKQFLRTLEQQGYAFRFDRKYPTLILPGNGRTVRFKTLGKQYTPEALQRLSLIHI